MEKDEELNKDDLAISLFDFLFAGTETSSTTLKWVLLFLTLHQEVQERCRQEILRVIGANSCRLEDIPSLPYTQVSHKIESSNKNMKPSKPGHSGGDTQARSHWASSCGSSNERLGGG